MKDRDGFYLEKVEKIASSFKSNRQQLFHFTEQLLERIKYFDNKLNSYTNLNRQISKDLEQVRSSTLFAGLPIAVKDLIDTKGIITTYGSPIFSAHLPRKDAKIVSVIKKNGGTVIGKTNTHQFALGIVTPPTRNPWDLTRIPGGSSGGSAAAVAAGLSVLSIGTDTGGSIRIPAAMCGVTGFKPSYGMNMQGIFPESSSEDHVGPICRYASDLRMILRGLGKNVKSIEKGTRSAALIMNFFNESDKNIKNTVMNAVDKLVSEGVIQEIQDFNIPDLDEIRKCHDILDKAEISFFHSKEYLKKTLVYPDDVREEIDSGTRIKARDYIYALRFKQFAKKRFQESMKGVDVLLSPTIPVVAPTIEEANKMKLKDHEKFTKFLTPFNYLGVPALTCLCGFTLDLPVGLQVISSYNNDDKVIEVASRYQEVSDWHIKIPGLFL